MTFLYRAGDDDIQSLASDDEGDDTSMKQQMAHTISNYEKRIKELQSLYDQDVFTLEKENARMEKEIRDLRGSYANMSNSNSSYVMDYEDLKTSYNDKMNSLKSHYEDLLHKVRDLLICYSEVHSK